MRQASPLGGRPFRKGTTCACSIKPCASFGSPCVPQEPVITYSVTLWHNKSELAFKDTPKQYVCLKLIYNFYWVVWLTLNGMKLPHTKFIKEKKLPTYIFFHWWENVRRSHNVESKQNRNLVYWQLIIDSSLCDTPYAESFSLKLYVLNQKILVIHVQYLYCAFLKWSKSNRLKHNHLQLTCSYFLCTQI